MMSTAAAAAAVGARPLRLQIVAVHEPRALAAEAEAAERIGGAAGLHAAAGAHAGDGVGGDAVVVVLGQRFGGERGALGIFAREVEQVDAGEDDEEAGEERDGVDGGGGVEAAEEDEAGDEGEGGEGNVIEGVDAVVGVSF